MANYFSQKGRGGTAGCLLRAKSCFLEQIRSGKREVGGRKKKKHPNGRGLWLAEQGNKKGEGGVFLWKGASS